jgi:outer membrane protein OmpA-like peptidoglycan-associated protein
MNNKGKKLEIRDLKIKSLRFLIFNCPLLIGLTIPTIVSAQTKAAHLSVIVNSNQDGPIQADSSLTLREAIALVNGQLSVDRLSEPEKAQVKALSADVPSRIEFNLPPNQTIIRLTDSLPDLDSPGLVVDGTTQPGYDASKSATAEIAIPIPVVEIAPATNREILRGLTIVADGITVRGLSIYGFGEVPQVPTLSTPPADIFIAHRQPPPDVSRQQPPNSSFPFSDKDVPPRNIVIENNWLGITSSEKVPDKLSAFGVSVFNSVGTTIRRNRIANHEGSAIISSVQAKNLVVTENIIVGNGIAGMPDAIRLEGVIDNTQITSNLICGNDGSGVFLFKPQGAAQIRSNQIIYNGRRLRRSAVYLMGDNNQVTDNLIRGQAGPGVVVTSYPKSNRNLIENNRFGELEGLSIDLNTQSNVDAVDFQRGDGTNPPRNSENRRQDTGNSAINAPQFITRDFVILGSNVKLEGKADPGSTVAIYKVAENTAIANGPLSEPIARATTNEQGQFSATVSNLQPGERVSAIATDPQYGTSEPAVNANIQSATASITPSQSPPTTPPTNPKRPIPVCTTPPAPPTPPVAPPPELPPTPLRLRVPRNIHFALDQSTISPASARVLDKIAEVLRTYPVLTVDIEGHTDPRASDAYNIALGQRRAIAARNYLIRQGIAAERMTIRSFGERRLLTPGRNVVDFARDRRAEFIFQDTRGLEIIFESQESDLQIER